MATSCCNSYMRRLLLQTIEWHTQATKGWEVDTWHSGRFLETWADPRALRDLRGASAAYDTADVRRALLANLALFGWLAGEVAERLGYEYPANAHAYVTAWLKECLQAASL
jgi:aminoglycoside 6-adenylyltransferase